MYNDRCIELAITNIRSNKKFYVPYFVACICLMLINGTLILLSKSECVCGLSFGSTLSMIFSKASILANIMLLLFMLLGNRVLLKNETYFIGLLQCVGIKRKTVSVVYLVEQTIVFITAGIASVCFTPVFFNVSMFGLGKLMNLEGALQENVDFYTLLKSFMIHLCFFICVQVGNYIYIKKNNPLSTMLNEVRSEAYTVKKMTKGWYVLSLGMIMIGYYLPHMIKADFQIVLYLFGTAMMLIFGTLLLYKKGIIDILLSIKKRKLFYNKKVFFIVSDLLYGVKKNAMGLAMLTILLTGILTVLLGGTALYLSVYDNIEQKYAYDIQIDEYGQNIAVFDEVTLDELANKAKVDIKTCKIVSYCNSVMSFSESALNEWDGVYDDEQLIDVYFIPAENITVRNAEATNDIVIYDPENRITTSDILIDGEKYNVRREEHSEIQVIKDGGKSDLDEIYIFAHIEQLERMDVNKYSYNQWIGVNICDAKQMSNTLCELIEEYILESNQESVFYSSRQEAIEETYQMYGGLYFVSIILGISLIIAFVILLFYKLNDDLLDNKHNYRTMYHLGMSRQELNALSKEYIKVVYLVPIIISTVHYLFMAMAVKIVLNREVSVSNLYFSQISIIVLLVVVIIVFLLYKGLLAVLTQKDIVM